MMGLEVGPWFWIVLIITIVSLIVNVVSFIFEIPAGNSSVAGRFMLWYTERSNWLGKLVFLPITLFLGIGMLLLLLIVWLCTDAFTRKEFRK